MSGKSYDREGGLGNVDHTEHRDAEGRVVGRSYNKEETFWNDAHTEYRDAEGRVVGRSYNKEETFWNDAHTRHEDTDGRYTGRSEARPDTFWDTAHTVHKDTEGRTTGRSERKRETFWEDAHTKHEGRGGFRRAVDYLPTPDPTSVWGIFVSIFYLAVGLFLFVVVGTAMVYAALGAFVALVVQGGLVTAIRRGMATAAALYAQLGPRLVRVGPAVAFALLAILTVASFFMDPGSGLMGIAGTAAGTYGALWASRKLTARFLRDTPPPTHVEVTATTIWANPIVIGLSVLVGLFAIAMLASG